MPYRMNCSVGVDIGTTTVKVCVVKGTKILSEDQVRHEANIPQRLGVQNAKKIIELAVELLEEYPQKILKVNKDIPRLFFTFGTVNSFCILVLGVLDCSELYNWMYPGDVKAAANLPKSSSNSVFPGYGMRTLCELASYAEFDKNHHWDRCGNIMDYFACYLAGSDKVLMSESNAYCWGYSTRLQWNAEILPAMPITTHIFPFTDGLTLLAAASMNGGNALDAFITNVQRWSQEATQASPNLVNMSQILSELDRVSSQLEDNSPGCIPEIKSLFTAERGSVDTGVEIRGLRSDTSLIQ
ncbi:hypothetical protein TELCIR_04781, partial [Teladorsagia circumcincta]